MPCWDHKRGSPYGEPLLRSRFPTPAFGTPFQGDTASASLPAGAFRSSHRSSLTARRLMAPSALRASKRKVGQ